MPGPTKDRLLCRAKRADGILNDPVRIGHAMVPPEMLKLGCDHEGLVPAALERVFGAFYTTRLGCLGLGLSIRRPIIEAHDGRLGETLHATWRYLWLHCAGSSGRRIMSGVRLRIRGVADIESSKPAIEMTLSCKRARSRKLSRIAPRW
jgi:hypothetical protein